MIITQSLKDHPAYDVGYKIGTFIANHKTLSAVIALLIITLVIFGIVKLIKHFRKFEF